MTRNPPNKQKPTTTKPTKLLNNVILLFFVLFAYILTDNDTDFKIRSCNYNETFLKMNSQEKNVHGHTKSCFGILETSVYMILATDFFYRNTLTVISRGICVKLGASKALNLVYLIKCIFN